MNFSKKELSIFIEIVFTILFAIFFSKVNKSDGSKIKLETMAKRRVTETSPPSAIVPPKLDNVNTRKPKNNTIEV